MADSTHYVIRGGLEGRERLRVLGRVMRTSSMSLFDRLVLRDGRPVTPEDALRNTGTAPKAEALR